MDFSIVPDCFCFALQKDTFGGKSLARGSTPLHFAVENSEAEVVKRLLAAKASVTGKDKDGRGLGLGDVMVL